jgi:hypothetical protein
VFLFLLILAYGIYALNYRRRVFQDPVIRRLKNDMMKIDPRVNNIEFYSGTESYTEDKTKIFICLRDDETGDYYEYGVLVYIILHELAHAFSDVYDPEHVTPEFIGTFNFLLRKAQAMGIYDPSLPIPKKYCRLDLDTDNMMR